MFANYPGAVARVLKRDHKLPVPSQKLYEAEVKGLLRSYKHIYGVHALARRKRQPFTASMWRRVEALVPGAALSGRAAWMSNGHDDLTVLRLGRVLRRTAHRLGEIVRYGIEVNYLTRVCVSYRIGNLILTDPSPDQLRAMRRGDIVFLAPCASKPDQFGEEHCSFPSVLVHDGTDQCAAAAIASIELERCCRGAARATTPLFADANGAPYTYSKLNRLLHELVLALFGPQAAATLSWHSFRIGLACELREAGCPDAVIQLICRWKCAESLQEYAQIGITRHDYWLQRADSVMYDAVRTANLPALDNSEHFADLDGNDERRRQRATQAQATDEAPRPLTPHPPLLAPQSRLRVRWGDEWWASTYTSSRRGTNASGEQTRLYRVAYDAERGWRATSCWHDLRQEEWQLIDQ